MTSIILWIAEIVIAVALDLFLVRSWNRRKQARLRVGDAEAGKINSQEQIHNSSWQESRWLIAVLGIILIVIGQWKFSSLSPTGAAPQPLGIWLTDQLHLDDPHIDQVLNGLPLLISGGLILAFAIAGITLLPSVEQKFKQGRLDLRFLLSKWRWLLAGSGAFIAFAISNGRPGNQPARSAPISCQHCVFWYGRRRMGSSTPY